MTVTYVETVTALNDLVKRLANSNWLALDTEFIRERSYYPQLCLLQVATDDVIACVDPIALSEEALMPLLAILQDPSIPKVFHAAYQDLEILQLCYRVLPTPVFDTQIAANFLGLGEQIGYAHLVEQQFQVTLDKSQTRTDWSQRPLSAAQRQYAANDVRHLGALYQTLREELEKQGKWAWVVEECVQLSDPERYRIHADSVWQRVKGMRRLRGVQLYRLQVLAEWREEQASERDLPRQWVVTDDALVTIAQHNPTDRIALKQCRLHAQHLRQHGDTLLRLLHDANERTLPTLAATLIPTALDPYQTKLLAALQALILERGQALGLTPSLLATRKELERLVRGDQDIAILRGWRAGLVGAQIHHLLEAHRSDHPHG